MKKVFLLIIALICFGPAAALGYDILVVQGLAVKPYDDAVRGFRESCDGKVKKVDLADLKDKNVGRLIREDKARLVVAVGPEALRKVQGLTDVPVLYLMVVNPQQIVSENRNVTGVSMHAPPERYFDLLAKISPKVKTIGVIYDPDKSGEMVRRAHQVAQHNGFSLVRKEVNSRKEVPAALDSIKQSVDAMWVIPDTTVVSPETMELCVLASLDRKIPIITFAAKYVEMGAVAALEIDSFDQGKQAGDMAAEILAGTPITEIPAAKARSTMLRVNRHVAKKLGISIAP